ncbi:ABC transporter ATP-binding protein [Tetragenococcus halophilus subsp. flandriensis]|uniref:ABC transporter ATP-binding protein n=1 Tax=Tetragenococcus halophilus TaxID=51669 RepID=UPI0023EA0144|nr:dipeptide/oligopeptide/nickel ABC transporter ATP-binding protein [Tetragenococcus halophilus]GMA08359.1 ABC transporter ATP-binding protein [Tetragenococcus halophilus subsp. flandriensis]
MIEVKNLYKSYPKRRDHLRKTKLQVLDGVTFYIKKGNWVALVGESGGGKSTLSRLLLGLENIDKGDVLFEGEKLKSWRKENQGQVSVVFQDYTSSVNPNFKIIDVLKEPLRVVYKRASLYEKAVNLMKEVELPLSLLDCYPHELSAGQLQRVCIARAISTKPKFIILDEAISSLDASIQVHILELLYKLKTKFDMTCLFIAHDLETVTYLCDEVMFLSNGKIVEQVTTNKLANVQEEYPKKLLKSLIQLI